MQNTQQVVPKQAICKYFLNSGVCPYGPDCQFSHQPPVSYHHGNGEIVEKHGDQARNMSVAPPNFPPLAHEIVSSERGDTGNANNGDQFFTATFGPPVPSSIPSSMPTPLPNDIQQYMSSQMPRMRSRNPAVNNMTPPNMTPPNMTPPNMTPTPPHPPQVTPAPKVPFFPGITEMDKSMLDKFAALNLAASNTSDAPHMNGGTGVDFGSKPSPTLPHSASTPSFSAYNNIIPTTTHHLAVSKSGVPVTTGSPSHSPADSPLMMRRSGSPRVTTPRVTTPNKAGTIQENVGGTTYFYKAEDFAPQYRGATLPNFSMFPGLPPHIHHMKVKANMPQFFMPDEIKLDILNRQALTLAQIDLSQCQDIPAEVDNYNSLFPLESARVTTQKSTTFGYQTSVFKALNRKDGLTYCLRRIHGFRLAVSAKCMEVIDIWKKMYHPNIVQLREVFTTKAFGDHSMVFVYDYQATAETLMLRHFSNTPPPPTNGYTTPKFGVDSRPFSSSGKSSSTLRQHSGLLAESLIWSYIVQLSSALRAIHAAGLACRAMDPTKILIHSKSRLWVNCMGIFDVLTFDSDNSMAMLPRYQQEDLVSLGKVVLALACNTVQGIHVDQIQSSMELVARNYSNDLKNLIILLLMNPSRPRTINDIMPMIGARFYTQLDAAQLRSDVLEAEVSREVENGRLFRLLSKMGAINERPEFKMHTSWSETGDRYMIKLFRDFLFHQVDETGAPWIDMAHVIQSLNKLDAGVPEKVCLMSRDGQNIIIVTYAELKRCFETSFADLLSVSHHHTNFT